jgi:hypothetical protein
MARPAPEGNFVRVVTLLYQLLRKWFLESGTYTNLVPYPLTPHTSHSTRDSTEETSGK